MTVLHVPRVFLPFQIWRGLPTKTVRGCVWEGGQSRVLCAVRTQPPVPPKCDADRSSLRARLARARLVKEQARAGGRVCVPVAAAAAVRTARRFGTPWSAVGRATCTRVRTHAHDDFPRRSCAGVAFARSPRRPTRAPAHEDKQTTVCACPTRPTGFVRAGRCAPCALRLPRAARPRAFFS